MPSYRLDGATHDLRRFAMREVLKAKQRDRLGLPLRQMHHGTLDGGLQIPGVSSLIRPSRSSPETSRDEQLGHRHLPACGPLSADGFIRDDPEHPEPEPARQGQTSDPQVGPDERILVPGAQERIVLGGIDRRKDEHERVQAGHPRISNRVLREPARGRANPGDHPDVFRALDESHEAAGEQVSPISLWVHTPKAFGMTKQFILAALGYTIREEKQANEEYFDDADFSIDVDDDENTIGGASWEDLVGKSLRMTADIGEWNGNEQQEYRSYQPIR